MNCLRARRVLAIRSPGSTRAPSSCTGGTGDIRITSVTYICSMLEEKVTEATEAYARLLSSELAWPNSAAVCRSILGESV